MKALILWSIGICLGTQRIEKHTRWLWLNQCHCMVPLFNLRFHMLQPMLEYSQVLLHKINLLSCPWKSTAGKKGLMRASWPILSPWKAFNFASCNRSLANNRSFIIFKYISLIWVIAVCTSFVLNECQHSIIQAQPVGMTLGKHNIFSFFLPTLYSRFLLPIAKHVEFHEAIDDGFLRNLDEITFNHLVSTGKWELNN